MRLRGDGPSPTPDLTSKGSSHGSLGADTLTLMNNLALTLRAQGDLVGN
jgi:hypothetical protein